MMKDLSNISLSILDYLVEIVLNIHLKNFDTDLRNYSDSKLQAKKAKRKFENKLSLENNLISHISKAQP